MRQEIEHDWVAGGNYDVPDFEAIKEETEQNVRDKSGRAKAFLALGIHFLKKL